MRGRRYENFTQVITSTPEQKAQKDFMTAIKARNETLLWTISNSDYFLHATFALSGKTYLTLMNKRLEILSVVSPTPAVTEISQDWVKRHTLYDGCFVSQNNFLIYDGQGWHKWHIDPSHQMHHINTQVMPMIPLTIFHGFDENDVAQCKNFVLSNCEDMGRKLAISFDGDTLITSQRDENDLVQLDFWSMKEENEASYATCKIPHYYGEGWNKWTIKAMIMHPIGNYLAVACESDERAHLLLLDISKPHLPIVLNSSIQVWNSGIDIEGSIRNVSLSVNENGHVVWSGMLWPYRVQHRPQPSVSLDPFFLTTEAPMTFPELEDCMLRKKAEIDLALAQSDMGRYACKAVLNIVTSYSIFCPARVRSKPVSPPPPPKLS